MEHKKLEIPYTLFSGPESLPEEEAQLLAQALVATENAYAPFSSFLVGCAVLLENGEIHLGNNQENRAFPSGICAERNALFHIGALGKGTEIRKIAIRAISEKKLIDVPVMPCGACRQVMVEYEQIAQLPFVILTQGASGSIIRMEGVQDSLMPFSFDVDF